MKAFLKAYASQIVLFIIVLLIIFLVFILFSLPMDVYYLLGALLIIIYGLYFLKEAIYFQQKVNLAKQVNTLENELVNIKEIMLEQQDEIEEYFLMWVHQMKTPITASQLILNNPDQEAIPALKEEMVQIDNYTNMALNYLKLTNPDTDMVITRLSIHELLAPLLRKYRIQFIQHKITLHYEPIETTIVTEANLTSLMIEQLLNNALKYAKNKDIWLTFDEATYQLTIEDNGMGIRPEDLPKIFDKGYSGFNGQLNQKASGIGLYIVDLIAKRLEQAVTVESRFGEGTRFTIKFHARTK